MTEVRSRARFFFRTLFFLVIAGTFLASCSAGAVYWYFSKDLPKIITVEDYRPLGVTQILGGSEGSTVLGEFYKERRYLIPYDKIPENVVRAFISSEDDTFFEHQGVNLASIIRAAIANFKAGHVVQGGSTITQQVAKSLLLTSERSFIRKIKEFILAGRIESNLTKQQILYLYLNQIYLGHGAYGVQAAAKAYYSKDVKDLTLAEAAILAGLPQAPGKYGPHLNPRKAKDRQLYVLRRMHENKFINQTELAAAAAEPVKIYMDDEPVSKAPNYYIEHVRRYLVEKYGEKNVYEEGMTVRVPLTADLEFAARDAVREGLRAIDKRMGYRGPIRKLKGEAETEKFLRDLRLKIVRKKLGFEMFMPDGQLDPLQAVKSAGFSGDAALFEAGETHEAVVTSVDDKRKVAGVLIGAVPAEIPMDRMRWARPAATDKSPHPGKEPSLPSSVVSRGDVVLVRIEKTDPISPSVSLDQHPTVQGGLFSIDVQSGNVLAMEGGYDFAQSEFNRVTQALRQPGSSFKPFVYAAGLENGFTPASILVDAPIVYDEGEAGKYKPTNFEEKFYGDTTFRQALIKSRNVPTIRIAETVRMQRLVQYAQRLGLEGQFPPDVTLALGSGAFSLYEMTKGYALFPRLGKKVTPTFISSIRDRDGKLLEEAKPQPPGTGAISASAIAVATAEMEAGAEPSPETSSVPKLNAAKFALPEYPLANDPDQVLDPRVAYVMTHLMKEVVSYGTGHDAKSLGRSTAGKTGTTNDYKDAWFIAFTPQIVTGVWVGYDAPNRAIGPGETGARAALPIWLSYMKEAVKKYPDIDFQVPPGIVFATIDGSTGKLAAPNTTGSIKEAFVEGTQPTELSTGSGGSNQTDSEFLKEDIE